MQNSDIQNLIKELLSKMDIPVSNIDISDEGGNAWFSVEVGDPHLFTGKEGEALYALNHLVRKMNEAKSPAKNEEETGFLIDINGFQKKRVDNVRAVAHMMAERARYFKSNIEVEPMSAFERRVVHEFLADATDLKTESEGVGPYRRVVIKYIGAI